MPALMVWVLFCSRSRMDILMYTVNNLEFLALMWAITKKFHDYLYLYPCDCICRQEVIQVRKNDPVYKLEFLPLKWAITESFMITYTDNNLLLPVKGRVACKLSICNQVLCWDIKLSGRCIITHRLA